MLSDGMDNSGNTLSSIEKMWESKHKKIIERSDYIIHTFGFGYDHDEKILSGIRDLT